MDQRAFAESVNDALNLKCEEILNSIVQPIACPTPEKTTEPLLIKSKKEETQLPEKYRTIADLFRHMSCSLRLLHLRNKSPTFENICKQVEVLAKRKFSYTHLAQMKYILSEGIQIDKVVVPDMKSRCVKLDMKITLVFEVVEEHSELSADMALWRYFNSRLIELFTMHPEVTDIPEAKLPEPFSQRACNLICDDSPVNSSPELSSASNLIDLVPKKSQLYPSFSRHFSKNVPNQTDEIQSFASSETSVSSNASDCLVNPASESTWQKGCAPSSDCLIDLNNTEKDNQKESLSMSFQPNVIINTPQHMISPPHSVSRSTFESPDMKSVSCSASLMIETPAQSAPGRLFPGSDVKLQNTTSRKSATCFKPAKRVLDFSQMEGNDDADNRVDMLESSKALHEFNYISGPSRGCSEDCNSFGSVALPQEVKENLGYSFEETNENQTGSNALDKKLSSLVDLVNVIDSIFSSVKRIPITKEELLHKIIINKLDIVEIGEVEEQMQILEKLVPDWICKKLVSSGHTMYRVKSVYDLNSVRSKLLNNVTEGVD